MRPGLQMSFRLFVSNPTPQREREEGLSKSYCVCRKHRELLRYYEQTVPRTCGAKYKGQKSRGFYPRGNESKTEPSS